MEDRLRRRENESKYEYIKRIVFGKLVDKTIDEDYTELSTLVFGKQYSSDVARRMFYGIRYLLEVLDEEGFNKLNLESNDILDKMDQKKIELDKARKKLQATKVEYNKYLRIDSRQELLYESIKECIQTLQLPEFMPIPSVKNYGEHLLAFTDVHYGAEFISENNRYSREIAKERFEKLAYRTTAMCIEKNIQHLHICDLADDIQGILRLSDVQVNDSTIVSAVVEVARLIALMLNDISTVTDITYYHTMNSNHTQLRLLTGKPDMLKEDLEYIIGNYIKDLLANNPRVKVVLSDKDYHSIKIAGQNVLMLHGHQIKDTKKAIRDYSQLHRVFYDVALIGHFHAGGQMSVGESDNGNTEIHIIPSFVGSDPYSDSLKVGSKAMSKLFRFEEGCGITENYTIVLN